jgi:hypothetical protein
MGQAALPASSQLMATPVAVEPRSLSPSAPSTRTRGSETHRIHIALKNSAGAMIVHNPPCGPGVRDAPAENAPAGVT